jgi:tetratricopeptide (TPR) repeat protein
VYSFTRVCLLCYRSVLKFQLAVRLSNSSSAMAHGYLGSTLFSWYQELSKRAPPPHLHQAVANASDDEVWSEVLGEMLRSAAAGLDAALVRGWTPPAILYSRASIELELMMQTVERSGDASAPPPAQEASWDVAISLLQLAIETNRELRAREAEGAPVQDGIDEVVAWNQLGLALWKSGQVLQAEDAFLQGINANPHRYELMVNLGSLYRDNNLLEGAKDMFRRAMDMFRGEGVLPPAALLNNAGLIELDLGNVGVAGEMFERALLALEGEGGKHHPHYSAIKGNLDKTKDQRKVGSGSRLGGKL